ncbi:TLR adapter interacting with SLC15A4 on the lysosome-like [Gracilinanus agilis]|uniref:TLR adapter interacting with SLC15A4 on the lysosome-like n=1 Tax=Gracilinanus agilis TaxID=191870 RepID=UPI001CFD0003|nr:TLR adapter interacting with SLC15A4 on the lysosome-like [Gracilinanus agilis]
MLAEAFLPGILYQEQKHTKLYKPHTCKQNPKQEKETWAEQLLESEDGKFPSTETKRPDKSRPESCPEHNKDSCLQRLADGAVTQGQQGAALQGNASIALQIPQRAPPEENELDLYRSWSCTSICQNYPDLHIGGNRVGHAYDSGCFVDHVHDEAFAGPLLLSEDIPLGHSPISIRPPTMAYKFPPGDDVRERSILLPKQPLTNSVLNSYMEKKVDELYKQVFEENLTRCHSVTSLVASNLLMSNLNHLSLQISQEQNIEVSQAREALLQSVALRSLYYASKGNSSELSTPSLQISSQTNWEKLPKM